MRIPLISITIALIAGALYVVYGAMPEMLMWHQGESHRWWQWLSAHFVHISKEHLDWNVVALLLLGGIIEQRSRKSLIISTVVGVVGVNIYLGHYYSLNAYAGLSGVLNTLLVVALYHLYEKPAYKLASVITLILSVMKVMAEYFLNLSIFSTLPWPSVPQAHFAGLAAGAILVTWIELIFKPQTHERDTKLLSHNLSNN